LPPRALPLGNAPIHASGANRAQSTLTLAIAAVNIS
jgi:hypothetical protein